MSLKYLEPTTITEAISLLSEYGAKAKALAGGTDLVVQMRQKLVKPQYVVSLGHIPDLDYIKYDPANGLRIGALATTRAVEKSAELQQRYPILCQAAHQASSVAVRNMATIGGNICNASPAADMVPALIALSAKVKIVGPAGEKLIALEDFFTGPGKTILQVGELLTEIQIPKLAPHTGGSYKKHGIRGAADVAIIGAAAAVTLSPNGICKDARVVLASAAPTAIRAKKAETACKGKAIEDNIIEGAAQIAAEEAHCISDVRSSAEYRTEMVKVFTRQALKEAAQLAKASG